MKKNALSVEPIIDFVQVPSIIHTFSCGTAKPVFEGQESYLIPKNLRDSVKEAYVIEASGDSMLPDIKQGDKLLVDHAAVAKKGDTVVAQINGNFTIKRYMPENGTVYLVPNNPVSETIVIRDGDDFTIVGVVKKKIIEENKK